MNINPKLPSKKSLLTISVLVSVLVVSYVGYIGQFGIFKSLAYLEVGGSLGWNWFAVFCVLLMVIFSFMASHRLLRPIMKRKIPIFVATAIFPVLFYYAFLDIFPRLVSVSILQVASGINPTDFVVNYVAWSLMNSPPANLAFLLVYTGFMFFFSLKFLKLRPLAIAFVVSSTVIGASLLLFGDFNIRLFNDTNRVIAYYALYMPSWAVNTFLYTKMWNLERKEPQRPGDFELSLMGD